MGRTAEQGKTQGEDPVSKFDRYHPDGERPASAKDWIWVFGSNLAGRHGAGAALVARESFGAITGQGVGPVGQSYAIPTKDHRLGVLPLNSIKDSIGEFLSYASAHAELQFYVTRVGCGLAGYKDREIAPLFASAPANCSLPLNWKPFIEPDYPASRSGRFNH